MWAKNVYFAYSKLIWLHYAVIGTAIVSFGWTFWLLTFKIFLQIFGAFWYLFSIERETTCWKQACEGHTGCFWFCDDGEGNSALLSAACPIQPANTTQFNFGIFLDALQSGIVESTYFPKKFFYCFWWGLQNLRCACIRYLLLFFVYIFAKVDSTSWLMMTSLIFICLFATCKKLMVKALERYLLNGFYSYCLVDLGL